MPEDEAIDDIDLSQLPRRGRRNAVVDFEFGKDGSAVAPLFGASDASPAAAAAAAESAPMPSLPEMQGSPLTRSRRNAVVAFQVGADGSLVSAYSQLQLDCSQQQGPQ